MKLRVVCFFALGLVLVPLIVGCPRSAPVPKKNGEEEVKEGSRESQLDVACDMIRQADTSKEYHDALYVLNNYCNKPEINAKLQIADEARAFLEQKAGLESGELKEVEATSFTPLDAHHLEMSFLLRDAAHSLEVQGLAPLEQARHCFGWVMRQVYLLQAPADFVPPHLVLRQGYATGLDRALAFLALLRQLNLPGCIVRPAGDKLQGVLAGVCLEGEQKIYLFDPNLGLPVAGPEGVGIATLAQVQKQPELLKASQMAPEQVAKLQVWAVCPLSALAPRMLFLERKLAARERVVLALDPAKLVALLSSAAGVEARVWNEPGAAGKTANSPTRSLRKMLPPSEGGVDTTNRWAILLSELIPRAALIQEFQNLKLMKPEIPQPAFETLLRITNDVFTKFTLQPREFLLRGQRETALTRLGRIRNVLDISEAIPPGDAKFAQELAGWRKAMYQAYLALQRNEPDAGAKLNALWGEDQFWLALLQVESEIDPSKYPEKYQRRTLTRVMLAICRSTLDQQTFYLLCLRMQEEAEHEQAIHDMLVRAGKPADNVKKSAQRNWLNTRGEWTKYLDRYGFSASALRTRLEAIKAQRQNRAWDKGLHLWETFLRDYFQVAQARLNLVHALEQLGQTKSAHTILANFRANLDALAASADWKQELGHYLDHAFTMSAGLQRQRLEALARAFGPDGTVSWLQARIDAAPKTP